MEHFLEGIARLRHCYINPNEKSNKYKSSLLIQPIKVLMEHFFQGNLPLRHLLNAKPPFMSWRRSAFNEVKDCALIFCEIACHFQRMYILMEFKNILFQETFTFLKVKNWFKKNLYCEQISYPHVAQIANAQRSFC